MGGLFFLIGFELSGLFISFTLFRKYSGLIKSWLGLCMGLVMMMWLPALYAFVLDFTAEAQILGLLTAIVPGIICLVAEIKYRSKDLLIKKQSFTGDIPVWLILCLVVPFVLLSGYLQYTHNIRLVDGELHVGQSTYGDLCLHMGIATSLRNASFPPDYSILPGTLLGYPFLVDSMSTTMLLFGSSIAMSFNVTGTLMMTLVYVGFIIFAWELTKRPSAVIVAFLFMFLNGGLGFAYILDMVFKDPSGIINAFTGYYGAPANLVGNNIRWVNVICDMMIPQRTLLAGWTIVIPCLFMLVQAIKTNSRKLFIILGVFAGTMPMIHTHSFLALGLASLGGNDLLNGCGQGK